MSRFAAIVVLASSVWLGAACHKNMNQPPEGRSLRPAGGQPARAQLPPGHPPRPQGARGVAYQAPKQWIAERPASAMRRAQFRLPPPDPGGQPAELVVSFFPGTGGDVQSNVDRWYGQFRQPDGSATKARAKVRRLTVNGLKTTVISVDGTYLKPAAPMRMDGPKQPMPDHALLAAIVEAAQGPWFFKAVGPRATIEAQRSAFDAFVQTFRPE
jgi:hypothetical protein